VTPEQAIAFFAERKTAYGLTFGSPSGKIVLEDLAYFCRARETCVVPGDRDRTYVLEGRRETWLRIQQYLDLTPEQLVELNTRPAKERQAND
jgi:hypothetical protein